MLHGLQVRRKRFGLYLLTEEQTWVFYFLFTLSFRGICQMLLSKATYKEGDNIFPGYIKIKIEPV